MRVRQERVLHLPLCEEGFNEPKEFKIVREIIKIKSVKFRFLKKGLVISEFLNFR